MVRALQSPGVMSTKRREGSAEPTDPAGDPPDRDSRERRTAEGEWFLVAGIGHDINNVLTAIQLSAQAARSKAPDSDPIRQCLDDIMDAVALGAGLARQLHELQWGASSVEGVQADAIVRSFDGVLRRVLGPSVELTLDLDCPLRVCISPTRLRQILLNLADNARDAMPGGGTLGIVTRPLLRECFPSGGFRPRRYLSIAVADTGYGIDDANVPRVFEPFFTTKSTGTGIGLATVQRLVREAGGQIRVESAPGLGTTFWILIPEEQ